MPTYANLEVNGFYLVRETEEDEIILIQPVMETNECFLLLQYNDYETIFWRKKDDVLTEIIEELTDEQVEEYENLFEDEDDEDYDEDEWDNRYKN